jgi:hypothetical protein
MKEDYIQQLVALIPEADLPAGNLKRFRNKLQSVTAIRQQSTQQLYKQEVKLMTLQRYLIAASIAVCIAGAAILITGRRGMLFQEPAFITSSSSFMETELYYRNEMNRKMHILSGMDHINHRLLSGLGREDPSLRTMREDLRKNPGDIRLTTAVLETYQLKIDLLDEMIEKYNSNK